MSADSVKAAVQSANPLDLGIVAAGALAFLLSLFPSYYTLKIASLGDNYNAWHGFFGWFAAVLALLGAGVLAARLFAHVTLPVPLRLTVLALFAASLLSTLIAGLTWAGASTGGLDLGQDEGHGFIYWLSLLVILGGLALSFLRKDARD